MAPISNSIKVLPLSLTTSLLRSMSEYYSRWRAGLPDGEGGITAQLELSMAKMMKNICWYLETIHLAHYLTSFTFCIVALNNILRDSEIMFGETFRLAICCNWRHWSDMVTLGFVSNPMLKNSITQNTFFSTEQIGDVQVSCHKLMGRGYTSKHYFQSHKGVGP